MNAIATEAIGELREIIGVSRAAQLFGLARSSFYYQPVPVDQHRGRPTAAAPEPAWINKPADADQKEAVTQ
jgi:hypothetical protein